MDHCEFKACLVYQSSSRTARAVIQRNPVLKEKKLNHNQGSMLERPETFTKQEESK